MPVQKKSGNLLNDPRNSLLTICFVRIEKSVLTEEIFNSSFISTI